LVAAARDELAPDRVALRPHVLTLVVEPRGVTIDDDAERHAVEPRDDAAVELRRAAVDRDGVALARVADGCRAGVEQCPQHRARVVRRAANDEIARRVAPRFAQPV